MPTWPKENKSDLAIKFVLFWLSPFFAAVYSLKTLNRWSSYVVFFLFAIFFGMAFTIDFNNSLAILLDGERYIQKFYNYVDNPYSYYYEGLNSFLSFKEGKKDFYYDTIAFFVSRYTNNYHWVFFICSGLFAYFALKTFRFFTIEQCANFSISTTILVFLFMNNHIFGINGVRFWTAAWVAVYIIFQVIRNKNKKYFWLLLLLPFIHGSYWFFIVVFFMIYFLKKFENTWVVLLVISFFISSFSVGFLVDISDSLPPFLQKLVGLYTNEEYVEEVANGGFFVGFFRVVKQIYINVLVFLFIKNRKEIKSNYKTKSLYLFLIPYMAIVNFVMPVPSLGGRFLQLALPIIAYIWLLAFKDRKYKLILYALPFVFLMDLFLMFQRYLLVVDKSFFFTNPFSLIYKYLIL